MASRVALTTKPDQATNVELIAANDDRVGLLITNSSDQLLYIRLGGTAATTTTGHTWRLAINGGQIDLSNLSGRCWKGAVQGIWATGSTGAANITELT